MKPGELRDTEVTPTMLAEWLGVSRFTAIRKLKAIAKERPDIVHRRGRVLWAFASQLAPHMPGLRDTPLHREVRLLRTRVKELEDRVDAIQRGGRQVR